MAFEKREVLHRRMRSLRRLVVFVSVVSAVVVPAPFSYGDEDWPEWRGARRDGTWRATAITTSLAEQPPRLLWRHPVGPGYSGPTVSAGRVYVTDRITEPAEKERIHCVDLETGESLWEHEYAVQYGKIGYQAGPRASVTVVGDRAYALGARGHLVCLSASDGEVHFQRDLDLDFGISAPGDQDRMPIWGIAASPLVESGRLVLHIGGRDGACVVALDPQSGKEIWRALEDRPQYSTPIVVEQAGVKVVVVWTGDSVAGLNLLSGDVLWRVPMKPIKMPIGISTPIVAGDKLFVTSFYDGCLMLKLHQDATKVEELWRLRGRSELDTKGLHSIISTPLILGGHIYGVDSYGEMRCLRVDTGERIWEDQQATPRARWSTVHFTRHGDDTWLFNERGDLIIAELTPQGYREKSRTHVLDPTRDQLPRRGGVCWSHPAFAQGRVVLRNDQELTCYDLRVAP